MQDVVSSIIGGAIFGVVIGGLARLVLPGKQEISILATVLAGLVGGVLGGVFAEGLGIRTTEGIDWIKTVLQVAFAALAVSLYTNFRVARAARLSSE
ncbi:MAG TPA: GlsB/YeaQ/YmgE family stress response membrane protein [Acidimicrobiia bacterium]|nr:GlsB/YeaQ/YmgE family stress response membrane protein [Acidimicrobiia bacterium]